MRVVFKSLSVREVLQLQLLCLKLPETTLLLELLKNAVLVSRLLAAESLLVQSDLVFTDLYNIEFGLRNIGLFLHVQLVISAENFVKIFQTGRCGLPDVVEMALFLQIGIDAGTVLLGRLRLNSDRLEAFKPRLDFDQL